MTDEYYYCLSCDTTISVSHKCPAFGESVMVIFMAKSVTKATQQPVNFAPMVAICKETLRVFLWQTA